MVIAYSTIVFIYITWQVTFLLCIISLKKGLGENGSTACCNYITQVKDGHVMTHSKHPCSVRGNVAYRGCWSEVLGWVAECLGSVPKPIILWQITCGNYISIFLAMPLKKGLNNKIPHFVQVQQQKKTLCKGSTLLLNKEFNIVYLSSYTCAFRYTTFF